MYECDICYNSFDNINILRCCKGKRMCVNCDDRYYIILNALFVGRI